MKNNETIYQVLQNSKRFLDQSALKEVVADGTLPAELHAFYNQVCLEQGSLRPEYATPLSEQEGLNQIKNVAAAQNVVSFWLGQYDRNPWSFDLEGQMKIVVDYSNNAGHSIVEEGARAHHKQWRRFVSEFQSERITPGHDDFREQNYEQFHAGYENLTPEQKEQDRAIVAVVTDMILDMALPDYNRKITPPKPGGNNDLGGKEE